MWWKYVLMYESGKMRLVEIIPTTIPTYGGGR
jgi:hypothetical protein